MTAKKLLFVLFTLCCFTFSCKKDSNNVSTSEMKVRYDVTWTGSLDTRYSGSGINQLGYLNSTGNNQFDNLPVAGNSYVKTVTISSSANVKIIAAASMIELQQPGSGKIKVYVNDKLVADQTASTSSESDINMLVLNVRWTVK